MTEETPHYRRSLYRAYRPQTYTEVVGQDHVARTLTNAITLGTVAHGYVFAGPRGTGKTSMARILAKALDCTGPDPQNPVGTPTTTPCGVCESCVRIAAAESLDVIEMDAASHRSIDDIRELRDTIAYAPVQARYKVYIIDEAHMLTREAFNALLKTLEEPPPNVVFVLATTEAHKLPDTIVSRCQRFDFRRPRGEEVVKVLRRVSAGEGFQIDDEALETIAEHSEGGFRDAIGALERLTTFATPGEKVGTSQVLELLGVTDTELLVEIMEIVADGDTVEALAFVDRLYGRGINWTQFINALLRHLRRLFLLQNVGRGATDPQVLRALAQTVGLHEQLVERLEPQASRLDHGIVIRLMELLGQALSEIKAGLDGRLQLELALVKVTRPQLDLSPEGLDARLRTLESGIRPADTGPARAAPSSPARAASSSPAPGVPRQAEPPRLVAADASSSPVKSGVPATGDTPSGPVESAEGVTGDASSSSSDAGAATHAATSVDPAVTTAAPAGAAAPPAEAAPLTDDEGGWVEDEPAPPWDDHGGAQEELVVGRTPQTAAAATPSLDRHAAVPAVDGGPRTAAPVAGDGSPASGPLLEQAQRAWPQIVERIQSYSAPVASMVREGRATAEEAGRLTIGVGADFHRQKLAEPANAGIVAGAMSEVLGRPVTVAFVVDAQAVEAARATSTPSSAGGRTGLTIEEAIALSRQKLDARLVEEDT